MISEHLNLIFSPFAMTKFTYTYFEFWNSHCMFIHQATFDPQSTTMSLLAAMTIMGGVASKVDYEIRAVRHLLDLVEAWIFSLEDMSFDGEIRQSLVSYGLACDDALKPSPHAMDHLRAAFIITIIQYWAGNKVSGKRTSSARFSTVVKVSFSFRVDTAIETHTTGRLHAVFASMKQDMGPATWITKWHGSRLRLAYG